MIVQSDMPILTDEQSAIDLMATARATKIAVYKAAISEDFFDLLTGLAGAIVQKFVMYGVSLAIIGDFSLYTSQALHDYIYESNKGKHLYFVGNESEALEKLTGSR